MPLNAGKVNLASIVVSLVVADLAAVVGQNDGEPLVRIVPAVELETGGGECGKGEEGEKDGRDGELPRDWADWSC